MADLNSCKTHKNQNPFSIGSEVEVAFDEEGFRGSWYNATILKLPHKSSPSKKKKVFIQYTTLLRDDEPTFLKENVDFLSLRPVPPDIADQDFEEGDVVDAFDQDGWWIGVVREVLENSTYSVFFQNPPHSMEIEHNRLRFHQDFVDGKWVKRQKMKIMEHDGNGELDREGTKLVNGEGGNTSGRSLWARATDKEGKDDCDAIEIPPKDVEMINNQLTSVVKWIAVSPANKSLELVNEVEPLLKISGVEENSNDQSREKSVESEQQQGSENSRKRKRGRPRKFLTAPNATEVTDKEQDENGDHTLQGVIAGCTSDLQVYKKSGNEPIQCKTKEVGNKVSSSVGDDDRPLYTWFGGMQCLASINAARRTPGKTAKQRTKGSELVNAVNETGMVDGTSDHVPITDNGWPFVKNSPIWKAIESLEVFRLVPQTPHFRPLDAFQEERREGLAIGNMVTFASLVEKITKLQFDDTRHTLDSILGSLSDLELHGFDISLPSNRVKELITIKGRKIQDDDKIREAEIKMLEHTRQKTILVEEIETIEQKIAELQKKHKSVKMEMETKDDEITLLLSQVEALRECVQNSRLEFEKQATLPLKQD